MRKFELHLDAVILIVVAFVLSLGFNFYQHYQYQDLLREHADLQMSTLGNDFNVTFMKASLKKCREKLTAMRGVSAADKKPDNGK